MIRGPDDRREWRGFLSSYGPTEAARCRPSRNASPPVDAVELRPVDAGELVAEVVGIRRRVGPVLRTRVKADAALDHKRWIEGAQGRIEAESMVEAHAAFVPGDGARRVDAEEVVDVAQQAVRF